MSLAKKIAERRNNVLFAGRPVRKRRLSFWRLRGLTGEMTVPTRPYYAKEAGSALYYDLVTAADPALRGDVDIYLDILGARKTVLELGTGTGRIAIALAEQNYHVTGLDIAIPMLTQAETKRDRLHPDVAARLRFVAGDLTALALGRTYDAILATYFTLAHLEPTTGWRRAFAGMTRHLSPGGVIAIHLPILEQMTAPPPPVDRPVLRQPIGPDRFLVLFVVSKTTSPRGRMTLTLDYVVTTHDGAEISRSRESLTYFAADPDPFARKVGLAPACAPIAVGNTGFIHVFQRDEDSMLANGAIDGD